MQAVTIRKDFIIKHSVFLIILVIGFGIAVIAHGTAVKTEEVKLYFVDAEMMRLLPVKTSIPSMPVEKMAQRMLDELIDGRDDNPKIRRLIPKEKGCMTVKVKNNIAYVDIKKEMAENHPDGRDIEMLTVYSIVNSLTGIDGIVNVRFTIEGEIKKDFMGYIDMRETFIPDYFV